MWITTILSSQNNVWIGTGIEQTSKISSQPIVSKWIAPIQAKWFQSHQFSANSQEFQLIPQMAKPKRLLKHLFVPSKLKLYTHAKKLVNLNVILVLEREHEQQPRTYVPYPSTANFVHLGFCRLWPYVKLAQGVIQESGIFRHGKFTLNSTGAAYGLCIRALWIATPYSNGSWWATRVINRTSYLPTPGSCINHAPRDNPAHPVQCSRFAPILPPMNCFNPVRSLCKAIHGQFDCLFAFWNFKRTLFDKRVIKIMVNHTPQLM